MLSLCLGVWRGGRPLADHVAYEHLPTDSNTGGGIRVHRFDASQLDLPGFTVSAIQIGVTGNIDAMYVGVAAESGDPFDCDPASYTQVTFGGNPGVTQAGDHETLSDIVPIAWDKVADLIVTHLNNGGPSWSVLSAAVTEYHTQHFSDEFEAAEAALADKGTGLWGMHSGDYASFGNFIWGVSKIILFGR